MLTFMLVNYILTWFSSPPTVTHPSTREPLDSCLCFVSVFCSIVWLLCVITALLAVSVDDVGL